MSSNAPTGRLHHTVLSRAAASHDVFFFFLRCFAVVQAQAVRSFAGNYHTTDSQPNSVDGKFVSDRTDKVRTLSRAGDARHGAEEGLSYVESSADVRAQLSWPGDGASGVRGEGLCAAASATGTITGRQLTLGPQPTSLGRTPLTCLPLLRYLRRQSAGGGLPVCGGGFWRGVWCHWCQVADPGAREFTYMLLGGTRFVYASAVRLGLINFVASMSASKVSSSWPYKQAAAMEGAVAISGCGWLWWWPLLRTEWQKCYTKARCRSADGRADAVGVVVVGKRAVGVATCCRVAFRSLCGLSLPPPPLLSLRAPSPRPRFTAFGLFRTCSRWRRPSSTCRTSPSGTRSRSSGAASPCSSSTGPPTRSPRRRPCPSLSCATLRRMACASRK